MKPPLWARLCLLVRLGLTRFWKQALPVDHGLLTLLNEEARALQAGEPPDWLALQAALASDWPPPEKSPLADLVRALGLTLPEALLLALLGEVERSHLVSLVVAELQAPDRSSRPRLHLAAAWLDALFGAGTLSVLRLSGSPLLENALLQLDGDGPLPSRTLRTPPELWSVLTGLALNWPPCRVLSRDDMSLLPEAMASQIPTLAALLQDGSARGLVLRGPPHSARRILAAQIAHALHRKALLIPALLWQANPALAQACRFGGYLPVLQPSLGPGEIWRAEHSLPGLPLVVLLGSDGAVQGTDLLELRLPLPDQAQRQRLWSTLLGAKTKTAKALAEHCAGSALLSGPAIAGLAAHGKLLAERSGTPLNQSHIAAARRQLGAEKLSLLAEPVDRHIDAAAIVLPPLVTSEIERLIARARQRQSLWAGLGSTLQQTPTAGLRALFTGDSGTGKTLAASYVATRLGAPLYRVDLSAVMNKYIGESEKNLSALLDRAAANDVVLLFDEADSLFGRRSEAKETGERFANMLTHFLLTRIETHPGIVILTSNNRERIDAAFTRRLDLIVEFPQPGFEERLALWRSHLGEHTLPEASYRLLASCCPFAGGQLRNIVLTAAACAEGRAISAEHIYIGLLAEYRKLGRELPAKLQSLKK